MAYYTEKLAAERLQKVYALATPPVRRYLAAEIAHVRERIPAAGRVLEPGCGYGRVLAKLATRATTVTPDRFRALSRGLGRRVSVSVVAQSSVVCDITV